MKMSELKEVDAIKSKARAENRYCLLRRWGWREHLLTDLLIPDRSFSCVPAVTSHRKAVSGDDICLHRVCIVQGANVWSAVKSRDVRNDQGKEMLNALMSKARAERTVIYLIS